MNYRKIAASVSALAVLATSTLTFGATVATAATTFTDASSISTWAADAVAKLADAGVVSGRANGSFDPAGTLNRAEVAKIAVLGAKLTTDTTGAPHFNDVKPTDWFYPFVETLYNKGVVGGINGGKLDNNGLATYNPAGTLNRAEASKILVDAFGLKKAYAGTPANFDDVAKDAWFFDYVETAYAHGLIKGYGNRKFGPADAITREQVAVIAQNTREEAGLVTGIAAGSKQVTGYKEGLASTVATTTPTEEDTTPTTPAASDGTLAVALSANTPSGATIPYDASSVRFASFDLTASSAGDVTVTSVVVHRGGLGGDDVVANVALFVDGARVSKSKTFTSSDDNASINFLGNGLKVAAGTTKTVTIVGTVGPTGAQGDEFYLELASATALTTNAKSVSGSFPVVAKTMKVGSVSANELQINTDGVPSTVKLGQQGTEIAKFKIKNNAANSDIRFNGITFKEEGTVDEALELANFKLFIDGTEVASTSKVNDKYLSFTLSTPLVIKSSKTLSAVIKADVTGGATKYINFQIDSAFDVDATDVQYGTGAKIDLAVSTFNGANDGSTSGKRVAIDAGELSIIAVDAPADTIRADKDDVVLGSLKVTSKAGKALELQKITVTIVNTGTDFINNIFEAGSIEIYDGTSVYDLTTTTGSGTKTMTFSDSDLSIAIPATGEITFQIRGNTNTTSDFTTPADASLTVSVASIGGSTKSTSGFYVEETEDDKPVTDVTPSSVTFKTISGTTSNATLSMITQSAAKSAVIGSKGVEAAIFEIKAGNSSDLTLDTVKVVGTVVDNGTAGTAALDNTRVANLSLYQDGNTTALDTVSGSQLSSSEATFDGFKVKIAKNQSVRFTVKIDLVNDQNQALDTIRLKVNELQLADDDNDDLSQVTVGGVGTAYNALNSSSARIVTVRGVGTIATTVDNTDSATNKAKYVLGNTTSDFVASYELTATNEGIKLKDFTIANSGTANMHNALSEVILYKADKTTEIARKSITGDTVSFTDVNYVVVEGSENIYLKVVAHKMGKDQAGSIKAGMTLTFDIDKAEGNESGKAIADGDVLVTSASLAFTTIPTRISAISFESTYGGVTVANKLTNGSNNVAILKLTTDASSNTDADTGASLKTLLTALKFTVESDACAVDADTSTAGCQSVAAGPDVAGNALTEYAAGVTVERINGTGDNAAALATLASGAAALDTATIDSTNLEIDNGSSVYYVVKTTVAGLTDSTQKYVQIKLSSLDAAGATANIQYKSNDTDGLDTGTARQALLLNMTTLDSAKVSQ